MKLVQTISFISILVVSLTGAAQADAPTTLKCQIKYSHSESAQDIPRTGILNATTRSRTLDAVSAGSVTLRAEDDNFEYVSVFGLGRNSNNYHAELQMRIKATGQWVTAFAPLRVSSDSLNEIRLVAHCEGLGIKIDGDDVLDAQLVCSATP